MNAGLKRWSPVTRAIPVLGLVLVSALGALAEETPATPPAPPPPAQPPAATSEDKAKTLLEQQAVSDKKLREEIAAQAAQHYQAGRQLFNNFDYEAAKHELETAVQLDRANEEASKLLARVNDILGVRRDRIKSAVTQLYGEHRVAIQEKLVELDNLIDWAKRLVNEAQNTPDLSLADRIRRFEQGLTRLERAKELMKWMPLEVNVEEQSNEVNRLTSETRKAISAAKARLEETNRAEAARLAAEQQASLRREREKRINVMVDQSRALFDTGKYGASVSMSEKILELDPTNTEANRMIATARDNEHAARKKFVEEEYTENMRLNEERANRFNVPHRDYLVYPENWREISQRSGQEYKARAEEPWKQEIRKKLSRRVTFEFTDTALSDAINFLTQLTRVNIILDPKVIAEGADKTPITLRVTDMEMETALRWILKLAELEYDLRGQAVFVTRKANLVSNVVLEIYDVRDLTTAVPDFPGPHIEYGTAEAPGGAAGAGNPFAPQAAAQVTLQAADLSSLIKERLLAAEFADPDTSIEEQQGKLVVMQRPEVQDRIRQLLRNFRETQTVQVLTQVRFVDVQEGFLENIGVNFTGLDSAVGDPGVGNAAVDPTAQPTRWGLFPTGGGPGLTSTPGDTQNSAAYQFQNFVPTPPFYTSSKGTGIALLHPRLDPNFPSRGTATSFGAANGAVGIRRQFYSKAFGSPTLIQGLTQNFLRGNPLGSVLGQSLVTNPQQGALFQIRFLRSTQANMVIQALRKDQSSDQLLAPKLMQFNNQRAHVMVAQQRSYISDYDVSGAVYDPVIKALMTGVVLEVRPTVSHDKRYITLDVRPGTATEVRAPQIVWITNSGDINNGAPGLTAINLPVELPVLELRTVNTTVTIPDNGTMLFSGLITDSKIDATAGIPLLSDLPIIGRFFKNNNKERERRNLLILLNSRVVLFDEEEAKL